jgi:glycosyltransferase involved in cell wall biosynthesis
MRIAMIGCKGIPTSMARGGGIERHVEELSERLIRLGNEVTVYVRTYVNPRKIGSWKGCRLITLPSIRTKHMDAITHTFLATLHALHEKYDVIHYHGVGPSTLAWIPRVFSPRTKVVVTFHAQDKYRDKWNLLAKLFLAYGEWTAVAFPHATIAISHVIQRFCWHAFGKQVFFIPNGVEIPEKPEAEDRVRAMGLAPEKYFLMLGRLEPNKAFDIGLQAFYQLKNTDFQLAVVGEPDVDVRCAKKIIELAERDPRVRVLGFRSGEELHQLISHCYAFIHPSRTEGMSMSVLEAMANGKVVIMSNIAPNLELIDHSGISFEKDNADDLLDKMEQVIQHPEIVEERGNRAREHVRTRYNWEMIAKNTETVYLSLFPLHVIAGLEEKGIVK